MKKKGNNIIDLEKLANQKDQPLDALGEKAQPGQEMFENLLAIELYKMQQRVIKNQLTT